MPQANWKYFYFLYLYVESKWHGGEAVQKEIYRQPGSMFLITYSILIIFIVENQGIFLPFVVV